MPQRMRFETNKARRRDVARLWHAGEGSLTINRTLVGFNSIHAEFQLKSSQMFYTMRRHLLQRCWKLLLARKGAWQQGK